jgi:cytochrome c peroxidase
MKTKSAAIFVTIFLLSACYDGNHDFSAQRLDSQVEIPVFSTACLYGGVEQREGLDGNANGQLDDDEVLTIQTQCFDEDSPQLDAQLQQQAQLLQLTGDPSAGRQVPSIDSPLSQLGMQLFFSKALSGDLDVACVSCHHPTLGGGDGLHLSVGVAADIPELLGPGRAHRSGAVGFDGGPTVPRNAPTTFNIGLWDRVLFHDGRLESLNGTPGAAGADGPVRSPDVAFGERDNQATGSLANIQARFPVTSPEEMKGFAFARGADNQTLREMLTSRLKGDTNDLVRNYWLDAFQTGFSTAAGSAEELITFDNITQAIAEYEQSQVFVETPWKQFLNGQIDSMPAQAKLGALLFFGEAQCSSCHSGDFFTDEDFHVVGMPQIGRGKGDGATGDGDFGRFRETQIEQDRFAFRTPSLLNVAVTGPYGHAGGYNSLRDVITHHLNPRGAIENYDTNQLEAGVQRDNFLINTLAAVDQLERLQASGESKLNELQLTDEEVDWLTAFLDALTDPCVRDEDCLQPWTPDESTFDPDGLRLEAIDDAGNGL